MTVEKEWNGIAREEIEWYPIINSKKCISCGKCVSFCHNDCFAIEKGEVKVSNGKACVVGCVGCQRICPTKAISFPDKSYLDGLLFSKGKISFK